MGNQINKDTLLPISMVMTIAGIIWWAAGMASKVDALTAEIHSVKSNHSATDAEIISQQRSSALDIQDLRIDVAVTKADVKMILKILEKNEK